MAQQRSRQEVVGIVQGSEDCDAPAINHHLQSCAARLRSEFCVRKCASLRSCCAHGNTTGVKMQVFISGSLELFPCAESSLPRQSGSWVTQPSTGLLDFCDERSMVIESSTGR